MLVSIRNTGSRAGLESYMRIAVDLIASCGNGLRSLLRATICSIATVVFTMYAVSAYAQSSADEVIDLNAGVEIEVESLPQYRYLDVIDALDKSGYQILSVKKTLLNRVRIRARSASQLREIVVSKATGSVLRDVVLERYDR